MHCKPRLFLYEILKAILSICFTRGGFVGSKTPFWVYEQRQAISEMSHMNYESQLQDRIKQLEKENADLKNKIAKLEDAVLIAMDLLMKTV